MELLIDSSNPHRSSNGGDYATGYEIRESNFGSTVIIDRCYGSDFEGEYLHQYELPITVEQAEKFVRENSELFKSMFAHARIAALLNQLAA